MDVSDPNTLQRNAQEEVHAMDAAMQWVLRLREEELTERDLAEWMLWYESDEGNKRAFDEMQRFWHDVGAMAQGAAGVDRLRRLALAGGRKQKVLRRPVWGFGWAVAASFLLVLLSAISLKWLPLQGSGELANKGIAEQPARETRLPDGSRVELAPRSRVAVHYSASERLVELTGGEAYFSVAPNHDRPFIVSVGDLRVRAVGTAFNIRNLQDGMVVTVDKGTVDVYSTDSGVQSPKDSRRSRVRATAGEEVRWNDATSDPAVSLVDTARALAWREGRLEYINEPLAAVIADVNLYAHHPVVIRDPAAGELAFTGTVFTGSADEWLRALPGEFAVDLTPTSANELLLTSRTAKASSAQPR